MSTFSFKNTKEPVSNVYIPLGTGIHVFAVEKVYYQPIGDSVNPDEKKKDGSVFTYDRESIRIKTKVLRTDAGTDSIGATPTLSILPPKAESFEKGMGRIFHIFCNMANSDKKEAATKYLEGIDVATFEQFAEKLKVFEKREVKFKIIPSQDGTKAVLPNYYSGFAECANIPKESSSLRFDPIKESLTSSPKGAEVPTGGGFVIPTPAPTEDDLPF